MTAPAVDGVSHLVGAAVPVDPILVGPIRGGPAVRDAGRPGTRPRHYVLASRTGGIIDGALAVSRRRGPVFAANR